MLATVAINLWVVRYESREARRLNSEVLLADALQTRGDVWTSFAVAQERLRAFPAEPVQKSQTQQRQLFEYGKSLVRETADLISSIARARVPMPKSTEDLIARCSAGISQGPAHIQPYVPELAR